MKNAIALFVLAGTASAALAGPITPGNLVVYRVGDKTNALSNTGSAVFVDEFKTDGTLVQSIAIPSSGGGNLLVASGTATSEGMLTVSPDGRYIALAGYNRALGGSGSLSATASSAVNRTIAIITVATGAVNLTTSLSDAATGNNPRGAFTTNGTDLWITGGAGGVRYATLGASTSTQLSTDVANIRNINGFNNQLYVSTSSGSTVRVGAVGSGFPTTSGQSISNLPGFPTSGSPYSFFLADLSASVPGVDTLYVADDTAGAAGGLFKYSLVGGSWNLNGQVGTGADAYRGLTGTVIGGVVQLYATRKGGSTATGGGELVSLSDTLGYNAGFTATPSAALASAVTGGAANTAFRGVAYVPTPGSVALVGLGLIAAGRRRR